MSYNVQCFTMYILQTLLNKAGHLFITTSIWQWVNFFPDQKTTFVPDYFKVALRRYFRRMNWFDITVVLTKSRFRYIRMVPIILYLEFQMTHRHTCIWAKLSSFSLMWSNTHLDLCVHRNSKSEEIGPGPGLQYILLTLLYVHFCHTLSKSVTAR